MSESTVLRLRLGFSLQGAGRPALQLDEYARLAVTFQDAHERELCLVAEETAAVRWQRLSPPLADQATPGDAYLIADSTWLADHQREGQLAAGRTYHHLRLDFVGHGVLEFLAAELGWYEVGHTTLAPIPLAAASGGGTVAEFQLPFLANREGRGGYYRFEPADLPASVRPWPVDMPLPEPVPADFTDLPAPERPGLYAATWPDGQLRCLAQVGQGQPRKWLSLWQGRAQAAVAWADSQAVVVYRPDKTLETISPLEPAGQPFPISLSFFDWTAEVILEILS